MAGNAVRLAPESYARLKEFSERTGVPLSKAATRAVDEWLKTVGENYVTMELPSYRDMITTNREIAIAPAAKYRLESDSQ